ncbi:hypothetical protein [Streptomyces sp. NPDC050534]|uniref:hypothetical protein n=1 Tax=Streptomyces sp. NPDC050534 TaxID=3365625 RepID=UPI0037A91D6A
MRTHIAKVLARESACLAMVTDRAKLADWKRRVVEELMTPSSPYVLALRQTGDMRVRVDFLDQWRELIAEAVDRVLKSGAPEGRHRGSHQTRHVDVDAQKIAVLILAALQGGSTLSRIARDPRPLNAALDLALVPLAATRDDFLDGEREDR